MIIRSTLLQKGYPMHWYIDALIHGREILREISFDDVAVINSVRLTPDAGNAVCLPCGYQDLVRFGVQVGQKIEPLVQTDSFNRLVNRNETTGAVIPYTNDGSNQLNNPTNLYYTYPISYFWGETVVNDYGEFTGRLYGWGDDSNDTYQIFPERNQIQLNEHIVADFVVLDYINNGMDCDAASRVNAYAIKTITDYIMWQFKEQNRTYSMGERQMAKNQYTNQRQILRARIDPLTPDIVRRIVHKNYVLSPKYN